MKNFNVIEPLNYNCLQMMKSSAPESCLKANILSNCSELLVFILDM